MSNIDISKIKPGDEVTVRCVVKKDDRNGKSDYRGLSYIVCEAPYDEERIDGRELIVIDSAIVSHLPKALGVGDRVNLGAYQGVIRAIHEGMAWVVANNLPGSRGHVAPVGELERIP